jgi:hypothetical protein
VGVLDADGVVQGWSSSGFGSLVCVSDDVYGRCVGGTLSLLLILVLYKGVCGRCIVNPTTHWYPTRLTAVV